MQRGQSIHPYFDAIASDYDQLSRKGLWSAVRAAEAKAVFRVAGPLQGVEALDLGCGAGFYTEKLRAQGATVYGVDSSPRMIEELRKKGIEGRCADISTLRLGRRFHLILAAGLVEFLEHEGRLFAAAAEHLHPGGRLVLLAPRAGAAGRIYELAHAWMGCRAAARSVAQLEASAREAGLRLEATRGAGPLAMALRFREAGHA